MAKGIIAKVQDVARAGGEDAGFLLDYLQRFSGLPRDAMTDAAVLPKRIRQYQRWLDLPCTGKADSRTVRALRWTPRCAHHDFQERASAKWNKRNLTFRLAEVLPGWERGAQEAILMAAWQSWMRHANIKIGLVSQSGADVTGSNGRGRGDQFDGQGGTLAWAYLPQGDDRPLIMKFDADERFGVDTGIRLLNVAAHEFGHSIGLDHSNKSGALMAPFYAPQISEPQPVDDITRIQALYGKAESPPDNPPTPPLPPVPGSRTLDLNRAHFTASGIKAIAATGLQRITLQI